MYAQLPTIAIQLASTEPEYEITADIADELTAPNKDAGDVYRATHLAPPPILSPIRGTQAHQRPSNKKGLDKERFEQLLKASRDRHRPTDLRKEVALKVHKTKQFERRALFLSKIDALPTVDAASTPVTPPESPAVFHFSLPSPGLVSPLALFETLDRGGSANPNRKVWVEQIDFRAQAQEEKANKERAARRSHGRLPSLDQITARMSQVPQVATRQVSSSASARPPIPLPAFLGTRIGKPAPPAVNAAVPLPPRKPEVNAPLPPIPTDAAPAARPRPVTVDFRRRPTLNINALRTSHTGAEIPRLTLTKASPIQNSAPSTATALLDRKVPSLGSKVTATPGNGGGRAERAKDMVDKLRRRISAPAALPPIKEQHHILMMRGGF